MMGQISIRTSSVPLNLRYLKLHQPENGAALLALQEI